MLRMLQASALALLMTTPALAADEYALDPGHSQVVFTYNHLGFSTTYGMFSGFEGQIMFDEADPAASSVTVSMPLMSMFTGWEARFDHFMSADFLSAAEGDLVTFTSTDIEVTGENTANITGDLTINDNTMSVTLDATLIKSAPYPFGPKQGTPTLGIEATTTILRSDFGAGAFAPAVSDELNVVISIEALKTN